jgi:23S rRNA pseudouridine2605 synthase
MREERLQKIISRAGIASRRAAEEMIREGRVSVNRCVITNVGAKADPQRDEIRIDGRLISLEAERLYLMLNKPRGYVTTLHDPQGRPIVTELLKGVKERVYPVGRLDYDSEGLLLMTNDGSFAHRLQHPRYGMTKTYRVKVEGRLSPAEMKVLKGGVPLPDGRFTPLQVNLEKINEKSVWIRLVTHDGRNRVIRRAFGALGHQVERLVRIAVGAVGLGDLGQGRWRPLTQRELDLLNSGAKEGEKGKKLS